MRDLLVLDKHVSNRIEPFDLNRKLKPTKQEQARFEWVPCGFDFRLSYHFLFALERQQSIK
jgi:hypothetical protein